jgi:hypothetical protein
MVHAEVWQAAGMGEGYLCIGCLEARLQRRLTQRDFTAALVNEPSPWDTPRLRDRKGQGKKAAQFDAH